MRFPELFLNTSAYINYHHRNYYHDCKLHEKLNYAHLLIQISRHCVFIIPKFLLGKPEQLSAWQRQVFFVF